MCVWSDCFGEGHPAEKIVSHFMPQKKVLYIAAAVLLLFAARLTYLHLFSDHFNSSLWIIFGLGCFLWVGLLVWYLLEVDKDDAWIDKLKRYRDQRRKLETVRVVSSLNDLLSSESANNESSNGDKQSAVESPSGRIEVCEAAPKFEDLEGVDLPRWSLFVFSPLVQIWGILTVNQMLNWGSRGFILAVSVIAFCGVLLWRYRDTQIFQIVKFTRLIEPHPEHRSANFYQHFAEQARDLGLKEIGDYQEVGYARTIFATEAKDCLVEIGTCRLSNIVRIKTLTNDGIRRETGKDCSTLRVSNTMVTEIETESLAYALKGHAARLLAAVQKDNLKVMRWTNNAIELAHQHRRFRILVRVGSAPANDPIPTTD